MRIRLLDTAGDWTFGKGRSSYLQNKDALTQLLVCRVKEIINDCFWDTIAGIDWFNLLGAKDPTRLFLALNAVILNTEGVIAIQSASFVPVEDREFTVRYGVQTVYGLITFNVPSIK